LACVFGGVRCPSRGRTTENVVIATKRLGGLVAGSTAASRATVVNRANQVNRTVAASQVAGLSPATGSPAAGAPPVVEGRPVADKRAGASHLAGRSRAMAALVVRVGVVRTVVGQAGPPVSRAATTVAVPKVTPRAVDSSRADDTSRTRARVPTTTARPAAEIVTGTTAVASGIGRRLAMDHGPATAISRVKPVALGRIDAINLPAATDRIAPIRIGPSSAIARSTARSRNTGIAPSTGTDQNSASGPNSGIGRSMVTARRPATDPSTGIARRPAQATDRNTVTGQSTAAIGRRMPSAQSMASGPSLGTAQHPATDPSTPAIGPNSASGRSTGIGRNTVTAQHRAIGPSTRSGPSLGTARSTASSRNTVIGRSGPIGPTPTEATVPPTDHPQRVDRIPPHGRGFGIDLPVPRVHARPPSRPSPNRPSPRR
jgi:hypothetical protein